MAHRIQNFEALATNDLRLDALSIAEAGYAAVDVGAALARTLRIEEDELYVRDRAYPLRGRRVFFAGIGKCAFAAATAVEKLLGDRLTDGIALDVSPAGSGDSGKIQRYTGTHPLPSETNEEATKRIVAMLSGCTTDDLVLMLVSGGGSTLLCLHDAPTTCEDEGVLFGELTAHGATIQDINTVRKHLSRARGGGLAMVAYPAEIIGLIASDVPGDDIASISSGPTVPDSSTEEDARAVLARYGIETTVGLLETPKEQKYFERVTNTLFLTSNDGLNAMQDEAVRRGYAVEVADTHFTGEARTVGRSLAEKLHTTAAGTVLLYAGESTVTLTGAHGEGGRNQELALAALAEVADGELVLSFASDGHDNTDHAGAVADATTHTHASALDLAADEYLNGHRSYDFFDATGDALITGYTGTNVSDFIIAMKK